jgi:hypothetical protein
MAVRILSDGEVGTLYCEICQQPFEFTGNGEWVPCFCENCHDRALAFLPDEEFEKPDGWTDWGEIELKTHHYLEF